MAELDAEELFHLALVASGKGDHEKAILYLKRSLELDRDAKKCYLLGAEYAEIGMYTRAYELMQDAVGLDPDLWMAHFQSGLLKTIGGELAAAKQAWEPLDRLGEDHALVLFKQGLLLIEQNDPEAGISLMEEGLARNSENPALNQDMERLLERVKEQIRSLAEANGSENASSEVRENAQQNETESESSKEEKDLSHLFLSAYRTKTKQ